MLKGLLCASIPSLILTALLLTAACDVQTQSGSDIRLEQPNLLSGQNWKMSKQATMPSGDRICTISAGELDVTQRSGHRGILLQVGTSNVLDPGDSYKVLIGNYNYETSQGEAYFNQSQSQDIIRHMMDAGLIYTETRKSTIEYGHAGPVFRDMDNKIPMDGFAQLYRVCSHFVGGSGK